MLRAALVILTVVVVLFALLWAFQRSLIYLPDSRPVPAARDVTLTTADGLELKAWHWPGGEVTVLVAGGNAGNRSYRLPLAEALAARGFSVLLMDYRGYGGNPGTPTEEGLLMDARAARAFVKGRVVYFGESLGAAVVTALALTHPPEALVLRSPFTSLADAGQHNYPFLPVRLLLRDRFPLAQQVREVRAPVTVVYGTHDTIVPPELSLEVARAAGARVVAVDGAGHNDRVLLDGPQVIEAVTDAR
ncbi:alpha/beta hydrolase [Nonomuraea soli]|uniref:Serine aminopeptidase S33 domain-containing protein n=1 Tax=Nonomuraea soli TaxID=1032476 RepID=A0A7W0HVK1_9ACTN|nr:alpha/beta fold hydrolase [Nonomuraea soli]MBA2896876.1 hypothetical protein [Nonomuraea soli]